MSHPFMPQPYYLVRQSRLSAPWPAPMGAYTAGIFDDTYLNIPDYIHEDRIAGFAGDGWYEGYGADGECTSAADIAKLVYAVGKTFAAQYTVPQEYQIVAGWGPNMIPSPVRGKRGDEVLEMLPGGAERWIVNRITQGVQEVGNVLRAGRDATKAWFRDVMMRDMADAISLGDLYDIANSLGAVEAAAEALTQGVWGNIKTSICEAPRTEALPPPPPTPAYITKTAAVNLTGTRIGGAARGGISAAILQRAWQQEQALKQQATFFTPTVVGVAQVPKAAAGGGTVALLGAAALALLLLRR